jgi:hypothetical protein
VKVFQVNLGYVVYGAPDTMYVVAENEAQAIGYAIEESPETFGKHSDRIYAARISMNSPGVFAMHGSDY